MSTSNENLIISNEKNDTKKKLIPLLFYFKNNTTSQDPSFPLNNLLNKESKIGWISNRFCTYPQEIIIEFHSFVNIKQINILINETKIPTVIEFVNCIYIPINNTNDGQLSSKRNNKYECQYRNIGFIKLSSNVESNYRARELRKIYVNLLTRKIKLIVHRNYYNSVNTFCQVGIVNLNFYGYILDDDNNKYKYIEKNNEYRKETNLKLNYADLCMDEDIEGIDDAFFTQKMDKKCNERMKELNEEMEKKKECEEYDDCKIIKKEIDQLKKITYKIHETTKSDLTKGNYQSFLEKFITVLESSNFHNYFFSIIKNIHKLNEEKSYEKAYKEIPIAEYICECILFVKASLFERNDEKIYFDQKELIKQFDSIFEDDQKENNIEISISLSKEKSKYILISFLGVLFRYFKTSLDINQLSLQQNKAALDGLFTFYPSLMKLLVDSKKRVKTK